MRRLLISAVALLLAACNFAVPQVTPTVAPSRTPSLTPALTFTATREPTEIALRPTASATRAPDATDAPTRTPTATDTPAATVSPTETIPPSPTALPLLSLTPSLTPSPMPSDTPTATRVPPTATQVPILIWLTGQPPATQPGDGEPQRTLSPEELALFMTPVAFRTPLGTTEPATPAPGPTLDVTPTFITQNAPAVVLELTPIPATTTPQLLPTPTLLPAPPTEVAAAETAPQVVDLPPLRQIVVPDTIAYSLSSGADVVGVQPMALNLSPEIFAQNPANPNQYIAVNAAGQMYFISDFAAGAVDRVDMPMFTQFTYEITEREENNAAVAAVDWARDGTLAFIVDGNKENIDGVWLWSPAGGNAQLVRDCPPEPGCQTVLDKAGLTQWQSRTLDWSPQSDAVLISLSLPDEGRNALLVARRDAPNPEIIPAPVLRYDFGSWSLDGQRLIVSGRGPDGRVVIGSVNRDGSGERLALAEGLGFTWTQDAVEYNGQIYALATRGGPSSPQQIITAGGAEITGPIGGAPPERVSWSPDHSAALVVTNENGARRYFIAHIDQPAVQEISSHVANATAVEWVNDTPPPAPTIAPAAPPVESAVEPPAPIPDSAGVTAFQPGEVVRPITLLNLRLAPSEASEVIAILQPEQTLTIVAGPQPAEGHEWYEVEVDSGQRGWVAGVANGSLMLQPEVRG